MDYIISFEVLVQLQWVMFRLIILSLSVIYFFYQSNYRHVYIYGFAFHTYRWKLVIHAGVDGFSRLPVYLHVHCSNNNEVITVFQCFEEAVQCYGLPSHVRCDVGGENVTVSQYMLNHPRRGPG